MIDISKGRYWDLPWSLVESCTRCSPGCQHCWALAIEKRFKKGREGQVITHPERLSIPMKRKKPTVYAVWNDLFHEDVPWNFIYDAYEEMDARPRHIYLILTKRPGRMAVFIEHYKARRWPDAGIPVCDQLFNQHFSSHLWHGLTVCNQEEADAKIPVFLQVPGKKFLSIEPMLGPVSLRWIAAWNGMATKPREWGQTTDQLDGLRMIDAVILGGETGPGARPMHPDWIRAVRDQCAAAGVQFFFKGRRARRRRLDGRTHNDLPWIVPRAPEAL